MAAETERVMVLIDGQNLFKSAWKMYRARLHPVLLARHLAGKRNLIECRYYSGLHQPRENPEIHALATRRHKLIASTGVTVVERMLQYHWDWAIVDDLGPPHKAPEGSRKPATAERRRIAREKGIDLALGLDAATAALTGACDTLIVVSRDRDLVEIAAEIRERATGGDRAVRVEVAIVGDRVSKYDGYDHTHRIGRDVVEQCRDDFDYRKKLRKPEVNEFLASLVD